MKIKSILKLTAIAFVGGTILTSCNSPAEKVENAEVALSDAEVKLEEANAAYEADLENHRAQTSISIEENKLMIAEFKASIVNEKKEIKDANQAKIDELEMQNALLEAKMEAYNADEQSNWENFKTEFNREMNELGTKIKELTQKDPKFRTLQIPYPTKTTMNKSLLTLCVILALATSSVNAQTNNTSTTTRYGNTLNLGVGIGGYGGYYSYYGSPIPVLYADYEFDVARNFTLAPFISFHTHSRRNYWKDRNYYYRQTVVPIGVKGTYYFDDLVRASSKWDFYVAGSLGFAIVSSRWDDGYDGDRNYYRNPNPFFFNAHLGVEYHINNKVGAFLDFSSGVSTIGIAIH